MKIYCPACKKATDTIGSKRKITKNNRVCVTGVCKQCKKGKSVILGMAKVGAGVLNSLINKLPIELHLPGHQFTGPGTKLKKRLNKDGTPKAWSKPINRIDEAAYRHDLAYDKHTDTKTRLVADKTLLKELDSIPNPTLKEKIERAVVKKIIGTKVRKGMGMRYSYTPKPIIKRK